ncbi:hypothetical protein FRB99_006144, partial [Tulasnella sp. 403]
LPVSPRAPDFPVKEAEVEASQAAMPFSSSPGPSTDLRSSPRLFAPFRRISASQLPSSHRESMMSLYSFDSLPEDGPQDSISDATASRPIHPPKKPRPTSMGNPAKAQTPGMHKEIHAPNLAIQHKGGKRRKVVTEILETERGYVAGLDIVYDLFLLPLTHTLDSTNPILTRNELNSIFVNFIDIWNFHHTFLFALSSTVSGQLDIPLAPLLSQHFPYLSLYVPFITAFSDSVATLSHLSSTNSRLRLATDYCAAVPALYLIAQEPATSEHQGLTAVHVLVSKITSDLNSSLKAHSQTVFLLAIQRSTPNLPFPLISPGRMLLKSGKLSRVDNEEQSQRFLLFSDSLIWFRTNDHQGQRTSALPTLATSSFEALTDDRLPPFRTRSRSDADASRWSGLTPDSQKSAGVRWWFCGHCQLVDLEVVIGAHVDAYGRGRFDLYTPTESFAVYTDAVDERDGWVTAIRAAKATLLETLNATNPNSTLTSSSSTAHIRRVLRALPHPPDHSRKDCIEHERRAIVDNFLPPVLCGKVVCATCSGQTFFVSDPKIRKSIKASRACTACYEAVFPVLSPSRAPANASLQILGMYGPDSQLAIPSPPGLLAVTALDAEALSNGAEGASSQLRRTTHTSEASFTTDGIMQSITSSTAGQQTAPQQIGSALSVTHTVYPQENLGGFALPIALIKSAARDEKPILHPQPRSQGQKESRASVSIGSGASDNDVHESPISSTSDWRAQPVETAFSIPSAAMHKAPVTIFPQTEGDTRRFSLVLSGKGTAGRGAGLDVGIGIEDDVEAFTITHPETSTTEVVGVVPSRSRRAVFEGLEKGLAATKLQSLLRK